MQWVALASYSSRVSGLILSSGYYLYEVLHFPHLSAWDTSGFLPPPKNMPLAALIHHKYITVQ